MIIVEGPDGSGKTHLIQRLVGEIPNINVADKVVSGDTTANCDLVNWVEQNLTLGLQRTLFDRHRLISEPIYGPILRERPEPGFDDIEWLKSNLTWLDALRPFIIWCLPPVAETLKNIEGDEDNWVIYPHQEKIYWAYFYRAAMPWRGPQAYWDYTSPMADTNFKQLVQVLDGWLTGKGL